MKVSKFAKVGFVSGFLAVALGAFAAHGLKGQLSDYGQGIWQTAVFYQFVHTLLLIAVTTNASLVEHKAKQVNTFGLLITLGILLFSGSLYALALTGITKLGMLTPIGGTLFLAAWLYLFKLFKAN